MKLSAPLLLTKQRHYTFHAEVEMFTFVILQFCLTGAARYANFGGIRVKMLCKPKNLAKYHLCSGVLELRDSVCGVFCVLKAARSNKETRLGDILGKKPALLQPDGSQSLRCSRDTNRACLMWSWGDFETTKMSSR